MAEIPLLIAFFAGITSFLAPCVLPLIPAFLGYLTETKEASRWLLLKHSILFVLGFSTVFSILGIILNTIFTNIAYDVQIWLGRIAGLIIIFLGIHLLGLIKLNFLNKEHKLRFSRLKNKELTSLAFGASFAVGWTPCVGAVLGSVLALAAAMPGRSFLLLLTYSAGLGIPFLFVALFSQPFLFFIKNNGKYLNQFNRIVGIIILILGILVFTGKLALVNNLIPFLGE